MNAPDVTTKTQIPANAQIRATTQIAVQSPADHRKARSTVAGDENALDDIAPLFPGMEVFHDLQISGDGDCRLLASVSDLLAAWNATIVSLSLRRCDPGRASIRCRLSGLTSKDAKDVVGQLLGQRDITSARLEHVILRNG